MRNIPELVRTDGEPVFGELPISVIVPACRRMEALQKTLRRIGGCVPRAAEVLVHVDGGSPEVIDRLRSEFPEVRVLKSLTLQGPGGSRNLLVNAAQFELVANFDDDSFPEQPGYFAQVAELARLFPDAAIFSAANHDDPRRTVRYSVEAMASGCGCVFRKTWFQKCGGFVPLAIAYNMEEVDMGLRLHAIGGRIIRDDCLRVVHDKAPPVHIPASLNAAILANTALFPFLRFPLWLLPVGVWQVGRRVSYLIGKRWTEGLLKGLSMVPGYLHEKRRWRSVVPSRAIISWLVLKRSAIPLSRSVRS